MKTKRFTALFLMALMVLGIFSSPVPALAEGGSTNFPLNSLVIKVEDAVTHRMLAGARFNIYFVNEAVSGGHGTLIATVDSDSSGVIVISGLPSGYYIVRQTQPPTNYQLSITNEQHAFLKPDGTSIVELTFSNYRFGGLVVMLGNSDTGLPVGSASFSVTDVTGRAVGPSANGVYFTDANGMFYLENLPAGDYVITQLTAAQGYAMDANPSVRTVRLQHTTADQTVFRAQFHNSPLGTLLVRLRDSVTNQPIAGAVFNVRMSGGADMGEFTTGANGSFSLPRIPRGSYIISQVSTPAGYLIATSTRTQYVNFVDTFAVNFENQPRSGLIVMKNCRDSGSPLGGARFQVFQSSTLVGIFTTNDNGMFHLPNLDPGWYTVVEYQAPYGFILDATPQNVQVTAETLHQLVFENRRLASLQIFKTCEFSGEPLAGARFRVTTQNGKFVGDITTDASGRATIPSIEPGWYVITETRAPVGYLITEPSRAVEVRATVPTVVNITNRPESNLQIVSGYILDAQPHNVEVTWGQPVTLTIENTATAGLLIVKTDEVTRRPLAGVVFEVRHADGRPVGSSIADGNQPNTVANSPNNVAGMPGHFITDANGRIQLNHLPPGEYHVIERQALDGYELDDTVHTVTVTPGRQAVLQVTNRQLGGFRLLKINSITREPIFGVEFMVFDANNRNVGTFITDNRGLIDFTGILPEGRYTIRETRPADGFMRDDMPRTVEFRAGRVTEIVWENTPMLGQIQIMNVSGDDNQINGMPRGTPLAGVVFEVYHHRTGNLIDRFVSGADGRAVSRPLPLGRYIVRQVEAPQWYKLSTEALDIEIEFATQIIRRDFQSFSANTGVRIRQTGPNEVMSGDTIRFDIREIRNESTIQLTDFYWRNNIATEALRLNRIVTGTFNQALRYNVIVTLNTGETRVIADNLSSTQNNVIDTRNAALGLRSDEFITSFTFVFGTVNAGFTSVTQPQVFYTVNQNLPNGMEFGNRIDVGGRTGSEWVISNATWVVRIFAQPTRMPRTGF